MIESWNKVNSKLLGDYRIFKLRQDISCSPRTGQEHPFYILESLDWINVIPLTPAGKVVLIHQYRHGTEEITLEIPGGMVEPDEDPAVSARRELREETGYEAEDMIHIGTVTPNPAFLDNRCHTFLAPKARPVSLPQFDGAEDIHVEEFDLDQVPQLVAHGRITHALVIAAFYHLERYR